ncbi:putative E4 protein [Human papillomavirus 116]|uniref:Putative E4 protein n=1 Tax=Human papillomavirus 116 TaxID=915428 RepID=C7B7D6_9PAPI|nr:putative E4 protein [Human papillomavirus 116]ACT76416.1 putative E4 protein [Human papillomavirus 116]
MLKMNKSPFLPTATVGGLRLGPQLTLPPTLSLSRGPPDPPRRPTDEERHKHRRRALGLPKNHLRSDDEGDENKENKPPANEDELEEEAETKQTAVESLLRKLEVAIDQLHDQVYRDLNDFKRRLGIRI